MAGTSQEQFIELELRDRLAVIHLNRTRGANAFHKPMRDQFNEALDVISREHSIYAIAIVSEHAHIFSAGADIKELARLQKCSNRDALADLAEEYQLIWRMRQFPKPSVSLMNGGTLGFGAGLGLAVSHPVMGEHFFLSMPEAALGFVPDVGASMFYGQLPGALGRYLALTGHRLTPADAYYLGLSDLYLSASDQNTLLSHLSEGEPIDELIDGLSQFPGDSFVHRYETHINNVFSADTMEALFAKLESIDCGGGDWARLCLEELAKGSPAALQMIHRQFDGTSYSLQDALCLEYQLAWHLLEYGDFSRGVENVLEKKPLDSLWGTKTGATKLTASRLNSWFHTQPPEKLVLPDRMDF